ncbi:MAG TPA: ATP-dependent zinc metalloprotease FtsH, partial [Miltoncostaeaceae bacterium]|nr:ATP-dependent zinc metalloprotease FtsH [Miltoncostaeaceae bacterium]
MFLSLLALNWFVVSQVGEEPARVDIAYSEFTSQLERGNIAEFTAQGDVIQGTARTDLTDQEDAERRGREFQVVVPFGGADGERVLDVAERQNVVINAKPIDTARPIWQTLVFAFGPVILLVALFVFLFRRMGSAAGGITGLGRSRATRYDARSRRTTFEDVAGIDEAEEELVEIVDFLRNPDKYRRLGAQIPRGVLLSGPPGTGKTLLARAVAGEADVPFFSLSASEFVEMIVGVGASRVRDLFRQAKEAAPAIIFIDELDAIGRARGGGASMGGNDEREQTLNQILTEMDGFTGSEGVIVLAATNRPEILDAALLRPGRFDRRVTVNPPDQAGRRAILDVHTRSVPLAEDVDLDGMASSTPGMVGADLRNLINEAALTAARRGQERVRNADVADALERIVLGAERRIMMSREERERTAYHEAGHALLGMLIPGADPVRKVSIVPRGRALGVTFQAPDADRYGYDANYLRGRITGALGGRAAEELIYGDVTTGAESDLEQVTNIARRMVGRWGMSEAIGPVSVLPGPNDEPMLFPGAPGAASARTQQLVDEEVRRIVDECYADALRILREGRDRLESLTRALLERETLDEADAYAAAGVPREPDR